MHCRTPQSTGPPRAGGLWGLVPFKAFKGQPSRHSLALFVCDLGQWSVPRSEQPVYSLLDMNLLDIQIFTHMFTAKMEIMIL